MQKDFSFAQIVENTNDIVIVTDTRIDEPGPVIIYVNDAFTRLTGYTAEEAIGNSPRMLQFQHSDSETRREIRAGLEQKADIRTRILNVGKYGNEYWLDIHIIPLYDDNGSITHFAAIERDITEQVLREQDLEYKANIDGQSGLLNKSAFNSLLEKQFRLFQQTGRPFALVVIDLDYFKSINDEHGHVVGDKVIEAVGRICRQLTRDYDMAGRIGGEEFSCLLDNVDYVKARAVAERIRTMVGSIKVESVTGDLNITASIGIAMVSNHHVSAEAVFEMADRALYKAKQEGRNRTVLAADQVEQGIPRQPPAMAPAITMARAGLTHTPSDHELDANNQLVGYEQPTGPWQPAVQPGLQALMTLYIADFKGKNDYPECWHGSCMILGKRQSRRLESPSSGGETNAVEYPEL